MWGLPLIWNFFKALFEHLHEIFEHLHEIFEYLHEIFEYLHEIFEHVHEIFEHLHEIFEYLHEIFEHVHEIFEHLHEICYETVVSQVVISNPNIISNVIVLVIMQKKCHFICCLLIFKYKTYLCVGTFWTSPAHLNNTVIIQITVIILVTIIVIRNVHTVTSWNYA